MVAVYVPEITDECEVGMKQIDLGVKDEDELYVRYEEYSDEIIAVQDALDNVDNEVWDLRRDLNDMRGNRDEALEEVDRLKDKIQELENTIVELQEELNT